MAVLVVVATGFRSAGYSPPTPDPAQEIRRSAPPLVVAPPAPAPMAVAAPAVLPAAPRPQPSRAVAPAIVAIPPVDASTLERVEPRPPLSQLAQALPLPKPRPKPLLFRPIAESASVILAGGRTITIARIDPVQVDETCTSASGQQWPCGRAARAAFRALLRGRAVTCEFPDGEVPDAVTASCRLGPLDIGGWLVANGWARSDGDAYAEQADAARKAGRGIFGPGPAALPAPRDLALPDSASPRAAPEEASISILPAPDELSLPEETPAPQ
ncbi:MAG: thermonuclease family protein [Mesorhizobium sp.]|nr:thermonuclease family protein [Mesorhizobium sp.]